MGDVVCNLLPLPILDYWIVWCVDHSSVVDFREISINKVKFKHAQKHRPDGLDLNVGE